MERELERNDGQALLREAEVAAVLHVSSRTVARLAARGELERVRVLGAVRYRREDVLRLLDGEPGNADSETTTTA